MEKIIKYQMNGKKRFKRVRVLTQILNISCGHIKLRINLLKNIIHIFIKHIIHMNMIFRDVMFLDI